MIGYDFKRYEMKYLLTEKQYEAVKAAFCDSLVPDRFAKTTIQSLYYDTVDNRLIRASLEKPVFKEKLRLRCYGLNDCDKDVFIEMKRKYDGVVYKRRITCKELQAQAVLGGASDTQIGKELEYFARFYGELYPKMLIIYDREAFYDRTDSSVRLTFDSNILARGWDLELENGIYGERVLENGLYILEVKTSGAMPMWIAEMLNEFKIYPTSFSKYGTAYKNGLLTRENKKIITLGGEYCA